MNSSQKSSQSHLLLLGIKLIKKFCSLSNFVQIKEPKISFTLKISLCFRFAER